MEKPDLSILKKESVYRLDTKQKHDFHFYTVNSEVKSVTHFLRMWKKYLFQIVIQAQADRMCIMLYLE